ncbi:outer membrane beta-barrel protein [Ekhidna sp.]
MRYIFGVLIVFLVVSASAQEEKELKRPDIPGEVMVDVGFNVWSSMPGALERRNWAAKSIAIYYTKRKAFGSKFSFNYGIGLGLEKMSLGDSSTLFSNKVVDDTLRAVSVGANTDNYSKNKLAMTYLDIPVEFRFHPLGSQDGEGLFLGVGGIVGLRLNAHTKWKYDLNGETVREKNSGKFNLNSFRYGYQIRAGFRGVHLFYKRYVSNVFNDAFPDGSNPVMTTVGINLTGF